MSSSSIAVNQPLQFRRSRLALTSLWALQIALAALFSMAGGSKLAGAPEMVALFEAIGVGQWFRYVTGVIEVASAIAFLVPALAPWGALLLVPTMLGAIVTHLFIVGGSPAMPLALLIGSLAVVWFRWNQLRNALAGTQHTRSVNWSRRNEMLRGR
jgi:uncharacterized membrane protein YphA (DoxX/SURF4 family)